MSWIVNQIVGRGDPPPCAGTCHGKAVVMGTARNVWKDLSDLTMAHPMIDYDRIAINGMIFFYTGKIRHGVSMHPRELHHWKELRNLYDGRHPGQILTHSYRPGADVTWNITGGNGGTSGLLAVMVGLALGYDRIVLCGVPMDGSGHLYDDCGITTGPLMQEWLETEWKKIAQVYFNDRVRSMSGRTMEWLGAPSMEWLNGSVGKIATD